MGEKRKIAIWGAGALCKNYMANRSCYAVEVIIDNDKNKDGTQIDRIPVIHPERVEDWKQYFIVIISNYENEITEQLNGYGLEEGRDFISYKEYCKRDLPLEIVQEALKDCFISDNDTELLIKVHSKNEYEEIKRNYKDHNRFEEALASIYRRLPGKVGGYIGECAACRKRQTFIVDYIWSKGQQPAWRETVTCPICNCNSRMRFVIDYVDKMKLEVEKSVFIYEAVTGTYKELKKRIPHIQGSEYLGRNLCSGQMINRIMHQDALDLSFSDESFDLMISNDVFEHVEDFSRAFREAYRCLKIGGRLVFSVPLFKEREKTVIRTKKADDGQLEYLLPPVYHGDPLSSKGSLVFTEFGWDILQEIKKAGFSEAYAIMYFSVDKGYFGDFPVIFEAIR